MAFLFPKSFPFCIAPEEETKDIPVGSGTEYPIGMSLADAMFFYWKNKTFSSIVNLTGTAVVENRGTFISTYSQNGVLNQYEYILWPNKMSEMICGSYPPYYQAEATGTGSVTSVDNPSGGTSVALFYDIIIRDKKYYPYISAQAGISGFGDGGNIFGVFAYSILPDPLPGPNYKGSIPDALKININETEYKADLFLVVNVSDLPAPPPTASFVLNGLVDREAE